MEYLAHINQAGEKQTVEEHLTGTARLSAAFAAEFGAEEFGRLAGSSHDIGKNSSEFQARLLGGPRVDHATAGALECAKLDQLMVALCVIGHHSGLPDFGNPQSDPPGAPTFAGRVKKGFQRGGIPSYQWSGTLPVPVSMPHFDDEYTLSIWIRMLYSCLVDADYLDTEEFMAGGSVDRSDYDPLPILMQRLEEYISPWFPPKTELNRNRCQILNTCLDAADSPRGIYTLTVPTGGGKTVASLAFALKHAIQNNMKRIIYVIPYTSIIEQNANVFRSILGENNVLEHHSGSGADLDEEINQPHCLHRLAAENWDFPITVTTAVQFFESLYSNRPSKCRKLHNIANSVIIFDEAQMIPPAHLEPCVGVISNLVAHFRATAVLCTATQPALNDLIQSFTPELKVTELCPNAAQLHESFRRVTFVNGGKLTNDQLAQHMTQYDQALCIVNTRKAAQKIYELLPAEGRFHLSTLMYPAHRQAVLETIRHRLQNSLPCRVVSTSLIEAGVDVDFPTVYRELAGLDSILQAAGRCNREGKRKASESIVTYFEGETPPPLLFCPAIAATREALADDRDPGDPESIRRFFTAYRSLLGDNLDKSHVVKRLRNGLSGCALPYETVAKDFHLIDQNTKTVFIPLDNGKDLCQSLLSGFSSRKLFRDAGRYSVNIYDRHYQSLLEAGDLTVLDSDCAVLRNTDLYDPEKGLSMQADYGKGEFI